VPDEPLEQLIDRSDLAGVLAVSAQRLLAAVQLSQQAAGTLSEVFIAGEGLARGAEPVFATLLHEAAHGVAYQAAPPARPDADDDALSDGHRVRQGDRGARASADHPARARALPHRQARP